MTCAIYCRLSKEDVAPASGSGQESESIQNQKNLLVNHAVHQGWEIFGIYCDDDYSGADADRPAWNEMLRAAKAGSFEIVLCKNQSRFTRDLEMVERYIHGLFPLWGIRFVALLDNADTAVKGNKKARQINGLINEWYLEDLSENVRAVLEQKRRAGKFVGSFAAFGYQKDPADHNHLVIDEAAAGVVRQIFHMYLGGTGTHAIARYLNAAGIPSPGRYRQAREGGERGGGWTNVTVSRILRNEVYTGTLVQGAKRRVSYKSKQVVEVPREQWARVEGTHQPIVDRELFETVQQRLEGRTRSGGTGKTHPLAGKARCARCGSPMIKLSHKYKGVRRSYLQCGLYAATRGKPACVNNTVRTDRLLPAIDERIRAHISALYRVGEVGRFVPEGDTRREGDRARRELAAVRRQSAKLSAGIRALYLDRAEGILSTEQFREMNEDFLGQTKVLEERAAMLEMQLQAAGTGGDTDLAGRVQALLQLEPAGRALYDLLIDRVEVGERDADGMQAVRVHWRF